MKKSELVKIIKEEIGRIKEDSIGSFVKKIDIVYNIDKTSHASERQFRHDTTITDDDIKATVNRGIDKMASAMIFDKIDIGNDILMKNKSTGLNVVGTTRQEGDRIKFTVITVMNKRDFHPKEGTYTIFV